MASSKETYCLCGQPYNIGQFMIECDCCREWFHGSCVDVKIYNSDDIDKYHCPKCVPTYGLSVYKIPTNSHRADRYEIGAESRPSQCGTPVWVRSLAEAPLRPTAAALQRLRPQQFTEEFVRDNGFTRPIIFHSNEGLDMKLPNPSTFTVRSVLRFVGAQHEVEVIDVRKQTSLRMPLSEFVDYFETPPEHRDDKVLNVLSLEFSDTNMCSLVEPPAVLRSLDWAARVWGPAEGSAPSPAVQKYCLISAGGSFTDFHVDFGGTTVWYHIMHGRKIFYLVPPTSTNLALYQQWSASSTQAEQFFGDLVEWYGTAELLAGQTLFIPSGWIHAVLTPTDSLVFGGNLLHSYAIEMQLQVYEIERRVETPLMFRYPLFEGMNWHAGAHLLNMLRRHNEEIQDEEFTISESYAQSEPAQLPPLLLRGIKILSNALKEWHALKNSDTVKRDNVPKRLNSGQLVRELCKELRALEKRSTSTANKDKDFKLKNSSSPTKQGKKQSTPKKPIKLTLPKPIMHMGQNGEYVEEKPDKFYVEEKEPLFQERYVPQEIKYTSVETKYIENGKFVENVKFIGDDKYVESEKYVENTKYVDDTKYIVDGNGKFVVENKYVIDNGKFLDSTKYVEASAKFLEKDLDKGYVYQTYEELPYQEGYMERDKKVSSLKIKLNNSPSSSREDPPPYPLPEHSILKSHLVRARPNAQQWTISKKEGDYQEQVLYTNEHLQGVRTDDPAYGPGMYSAEDIQPDYQYSEAAKPGSYQPEYFPQDIAYTYPRYDELPATIHQGASYSNGPVQETSINGYHHNQLPSYDAAIAHQYGTTTDTYTIEDKKASPPPSPLPVRRSVRPVRRRVSNTYDYEDSDLYIDDAPAPRRKRATPRHKPQPYRQPAVTSNTSCNTYRQPAPANGIESLIQASVIADEQPVNDTEDAAVAGMLSIGGSAPAYSPPAAFGLAIPKESSPLPETHSSGSPTKRARKQTTATDSADDNFDDEEDVIKEVHRDEEYVYPSLEMSSEDEEEWSSSRRRRNSRNRVDKGKAEKDESWSPRARLGRLVPRLRGPARAGVRRECVRAALHAAAHAPPAPHPPPPPPPPQNAKRAVLATKSKRPPPPVHNTPNNKNSRLKKGMKTAKQRLGKILKIHKMMY